jgi:Flp pilus assembly pilin Flp
MRQIRNLFRNDDGQDLVEYTLVVAAIAFAGVALYMGSGDSVNRMWQTANNDLQLTSAATTPSGGATTPPSGGGGGTPLPSGNPDCGNGNGGHGCHH